MTRPTHATRTPHHEPGRRGPGQVHGEHASPRFPRRSHHSTVERVRYGRDAWRRNRPITRPRAREPPPPDRHVARLARPGAPRGSAADHRAGADGSEGALVSESLVNRTYVRSRT